MSDGAGEQRSAPSEGSGLGNLLGRLELGGELGVGMASLPGCAEPDPSLGCPALPGMGEHPHRCSSRAEPVLALPP